jgi:GDP/UDP-N,N'-diacetylbacillosamine 2-epimerase (hydrolysing)
MAKRKICVVTGTRAEYGLLHWLMREIDDDSELTLQIIATGMHLSPKFGLTYKQIENDGFIIDEKVEMLLSSDTSTGISQSTGLGIIGLSGAFSRLQPDVVVLLGDRFEIFAAASAAMLNRIPIAHIHGGEASEGAIDDAIRHSITKMSHLHFVAAKPYRHRVIQMGESPSRVFLTGAPGLDYINKMEYMDLKTLSDNLSMDLSETVFLVTYHPVTLLGSPIDAFNQLLTALDAFPNAKIVFTMPNADVEGNSIIELIEDYVSKNIERAKAFVSLGQKRYLSLMKFSHVVIGNSSSGIIEAPSMRVPTVNIGARQQGRLRASSIIDCKESAPEIIKAITKALSSNFRKLVNSTENPYSDGYASGKIKKELKNIKLKGILLKKFHDTDTQKTIE